MHCKGDRSVLLAHPSPLFTQALQGALLGNGLDDVRRADALPQAVAELIERPASLTLAGSELAADGVASLVTELLDAGTSSVIVLCPMVNDEDLITALEAGALGYVGRNQTLDRLVYDVHGALRGEACLPRDKLAPVLRLLIERRRAEDHRLQLLRRLSRRESEVLEHLTAGATNDEIASALFLSQATVRTHVQNILGKLEVHSRLEAISLAHGGGMSAMAREDRS